MSYISILVPAFSVKETEESEIKKIICEQFEKETDEFELVLFNKSEKNEFAVKFNQIDLSVAKIEDLIYQRDCIKSLVEKTFESLKSLTEKLNQIQKDIQTNDNKNTELILENTELSNLTSDNIKLKNLLSIQIENSENFRNNTERTLSKIKEEFNNIVMELEELRRQSSKKHKSLNSIDIYERSFLSPLEEKDLITKNLENTNSNNNNNPNFNSGSVNNFANSTSNNISNNQKNKKKGGIPKLNFMK